MKTGIDYVGGRRYYYKELPNGSRHYTKHVPLIPNLQATGEEAFRKVLREIVPSTLEKDGSWTHWYGSGSKRTRGRQSIFSDLEDALVAEIRRR